MKDNAAAVIDIKTKERLESGGADKQKKQRVLQDVDLRSAIERAKATGKSVPLSDQAHSNKKAGLLFIANPSGRGWFYFRYTVRPGKQDPFPLGAYVPRSKDGKPKDGTAKDDAGAGGLTLSGARDKYREYAKLYQEGVTDIRAHENAKRRSAEEARRLAEEARIKAAEPKPDVSFKALLLEYVEDLRLRKKRSINDVDYVFRHYIFDDPRYKTLTETPAAEVTTGQIGEVLRNMLEDEIIATTIHVRSYVHAAYQFGLGTVHDVTVPEKVDLYQLKYNPVAAIPTKRLLEMSVPGERNLDEPDMHHFMMELNKVSNGLARDALALNVLLAGQRLRQLLEVEQREVSITKREILLWDWKGPRTKPRAHVLPLEGAALKIVERLMVQNAGEQYLFQRPGRKPLLRDTVSKLVTEISRQLLADGKVQEGFQFSDLRRTCETLLASIGVPESFRAQILSHGISGVQSKHYDRYKYFAEKQRGLRVWARKLRAIKLGTGEYCHWDQPEPVAQPLSLVA